jgi:hypothetical protein
MKSMTLSKYIEIKRPIYQILKIKPHTSIRNYNSTVLAKMVADMYRSIEKSIKRIERKLIIETSVKCSYLIDIWKNQVNFYFIVPSQYKYMAKEKIMNVWPQVTIQEVDVIPEFSIDPTVYQLIYKKNDCLSLHVDKKSNTPLNNILNIIEILEEGDRVAILYNFMPTTQQGWNAQCKNVAQRYYNNDILDKRVGPLFIMQTIFNILLDIFASILSSMESEITKGSPIEQLTEYLKTHKAPLSECTLKKRTDTILNTQIAVISSSTNKNRAINNALVVCQGYREIEGDNEFVYKKVKSKEINYTDYKIKGIEVNKTSTLECQNFIQLPGRELLEKHKAIDHINVLETSIPKELSKGVMCLGESTYKGTKQKAYISSDQSFKYLTLCLIGPTRSGKTTLISNLCFDSLKNGETNIIFDWCGNCELSDDVIKALKPLGVKTLIIDCSDIKKCQGLGYNELYTDINNAFECYRSAKTQASQLMTLVNAIQGGDEDLRARMERYLTSAAIIGFINNGPIKDVFGILQHHEIRKSYIDRIPKDQKENMEEYIGYIRELDEFDKQGNIVGTKIAAIQGILNRLNKLKQNTYLELMLKKDCENNFNLVKEMQKSELICIKMPEILFSTEQEKYIYATYWLTKVWGALQRRKWEIGEKERVKVNMFFDELYQTTACQDFLRSKLSQIAKFGAKPIISCHYLAQISLIRNELKAANSSYILISGSDKDNYKDLKDELDPYSLEDLLKLKRYHAINLIRYEGGWAKFITSLPKPL